MHTVSKCLASTEVDRAEQIQVPYLSPGISPTGHRDGAAIHHYIDA
jgi:hypothetical protein